MKLRLFGHDYKYAVEQIMLALFPDERAQYIASDDGHMECADISGAMGESSELIPSDASNDNSFSADSRLSYGSMYVQATTVIKSAALASRGTARVKRDQLTDKLVTDRLLQRIIKQSFYKAALSFIDSPPVWGSLTGIRPANIAARALTKGKGDKSAALMLSREYHVSPERAALCVDAARSALCVAQLLDPMDIALYVGIPFCPSRCSYCSFVSNSVEKSFELVDPFVETLLLEIEMAAELADTLGLRVVAVYIGGGTPTALPVESLSKVMQTLKDTFDFKQLLEHTVEAGRPDTITAEKLEIMRLMGADRVCVNPQSMSQAVLTEIGRSHTPEDVFRAVSLVRNTGMSLNMDLIAGLPADTLGGFRDSLNTVLSFHPENITVHTLSLKKGSRIMLEDTNRPSGLVVGEMLEYAAQALRGKAYHPYYLYRQKFTSGGFENIGWCLPGREGIYNVCMMEELCTVLSLGGGAATKLVSPNGRIERLFNAKYPREYIMRSDKTADKMKKIKDIYDEYYTEITKKV